MFTVMKSELVASPSLTSRRKLYVPGTAVWKLGFAVFGFRRVTVGAGAWVHRNVNAGPSGSKLCDPFSAMRLVTAEMSGPAMATGTVLLVRRPTKFDVGDER